jgi:hypothetical protein
MNLDAFLESVKPKGPRSRMRAFVADIKKLRSLGYSLQQICDYLKSNGVESTVAGVSAFLAREDQSKRSPDAGGSF